MNFSPMTKITVYYKNCLKFNFNEKQIKAPINLHQETNSNKSILQ